jgi:hypothetical protein
LYDEWAARNAQDIASFSFDEYHATPTPNVGSSQQSTPSFVPEPTVEPSASTPTTLTYAVGDVINITQDSDPWAEFTVLEVKQKFVDPAGYFNDKPQTKGYVFLTADVRYDALTDGVDYNPFDFQIFVDGLAVETFAYASNGPKPELSSGTLPSGRSAQGWLLYEVPATGKVLLSYGANMFTSGPPVFEVVLRAA